MLNAFDEERQMKENKCLYFMKGISCLVVILLHVPFPGIIGDAIIYGLRFPVPIFFMISGYVCYFQDPSRIKVSCWKTLKLLVCSEAVCALVKFVFCDGSIFEQIKAMSFWRHPISSIMFGTLFNETLWYLYAIVWIYVFLYWLKTNNAVKRSYILIPILLSLHIMGRLLIQNYGDINVWIMLFRSWLLYGLPFFLLGHFVAEKKETIRGYMTNRTCTLLMALGGILMIAEYLIWHTYMDLWFSTLFISLALFLFAIVNPNIEVVPALVKIGKQYSKIIYVSHIPVAIILDEVVTPYFANTVYDWIKPLLVFTGALTAAVIVERITAGRRRTLQS